jgi:hypothetical protein
VVPAQTVAEVDGGRRLQHEPLVHDPLVAQLGLDEPRHALSREPSRHDFNVEHLMWGADFPHHEGTSPNTTEALRANFAALPDDEVRGMLWENAGQCYPFDLAHLQRVADRIGAPTMDDIRVPLPREHYPRWPEDTACPTFAPAEDVAANNPGAAA